MPTASICEFERLGPGAGRYWSLYDRGVWAKPDSCALGSSFEEMLGGKGIFSVATK